jgi:uncharacterized protein (UPF0332 family)
MLNWEQWRDKSESSSEAAQILLARDKPIEAASRAYYAAYQMVTAVLIRLNLSPREAFGNWAHHEVEMYQTHVCKKANLGFREQQALKHLFPKFRTLMEIRYRADYGDHSKTTAFSSVSSLWRDANRLVSLLNALIRRGLL